MILEIWSPFLPIFEQKGGSADKMDAIFGNFIKNATKYVADDFFRPHRNRFCQCSKPNASVERRLRVLWGRPLSGQQMINEKSKVTE